MKTAFSICCSEPSRGSAPPVARRGSPSSLARNYTQHLSTKLPELWTGSERLGFTLRYFVLPLTRCVLRYEKSLREVILGVWESSTISPYTLMVIVSSLHAGLAYGSFRRKALLSTAGQSRISVVFYILHVYHA